MKILVTGAAGFIGSHLMAALNKEYPSLYGIDQVFGIDHDELAIEAHPEINVHYDDASDVADLRIPIPYGVIVHLAAQPSVPVSMDRPELDVRFNVHLTTKIAKMAKDTGAHLIFASSCAVYGDILEGSASETHRENPISVYGVSKFASEQIIKVLDVNHTILRFGNVYGPGQSSRGPSNVIAKWCRAMLDGVIPICRGNPDMMVRDYVHVDDAVDMILKVIQGGSRESTFNVGSGRGRSLTSVFSVCAMATGYDGPQMAIVKRGVGDPQHIVLTTAKAWQAYEWTTKVQFPIGVQTVVDSLRL